MFPGGDDEYYNSTLNNDTKIHHKNTFTTENIQAQDSTARRNPPGKMNGWEEEGGEVCVATRDFMAGR